MDLCDVRTSCIFEDEIFYQKGVVLDQFVVKRGWIIERWKVQDPRVIPNIVRKTISDLIAKTV